MSRPARRVLRPGVAACLLAIASIVAPPAAAQESDKENKEELRDVPPPAADLTASELFEKGRAAFESGDFATAEKLLGQFQTQYGAAAEVAKAIEANRPLLALCKVHLKKFGEAAESIDEALKAADLDRRVRGELSFWRGICHMQAAEYAEAQHALGAFYQDQTNDHLKRREALILFGTCYTLAGYEDAAAEFFGAQIPRLREEPAGKEVAGRAVVLQLHALMQNGRYRDALELVRAQYPRLDEVTQIISFQSLSLELGSRFLEAKEFHNAIACLQRVWDRDRLERHQTEKLNTMVARREILGQRPERRAALFTLEGMITRVERELANFRKMENFDAALRLRLATAFQGLGRYREAALILEDMLLRLEPGAVVESATLALIQNWMQIERWSKAAETADIYVEKFGDWEEGKRVPLVLFLKAQALQSDEKYEEAAAVYAGIATKFGDSDIASKAQFMNGFVMLLQDRPEDALEVFARFEDEYPASGRLIEDASYWQGTALSLRKDYAVARDHMERYLGRFGGANARYHVEATFRIAFCTHALADYPGSIAQFESFLGEHGGDPLSDEARLLLGDALLGEGEIERGIASFKSIRPEATRFFEDGWFKIGKALRLTEDVEGMREHFNEFRRKYAGSHRLPEAVYWIGWTHRAEGEPEKTREIYWETIREHGDDPDLHAVADLFMALPKLYAGEEEKGRLEKELETLGEEAARREQETLAFRALWARARLHAATNGEAGRAFMLAASKKADAKRHNPLLVADCADALRETGNYRQAKELYEGIRKWHPRAVQKDRAYAGLGFVSREKGEIEGAIAYFEKFERETAGSPLLGEVLRSKALLLAAEGRRELAIRTLEEILENEAVPSREKALALFDYGNLWWEAEEYRKAAAYYERIYVAYGKYRDVVAKAYFQRGQALEKLAMSEEALAVYRELSDRDDLANFKESRRAGANIARLEMRLDENREEGGKKE